MLTREEYNVNNLSFTYWQFFEDNYEVSKANKGSSPWKVFYRKDIFGNFKKQQQVLEKYLWRNSFLVKLQASSLLFHSYVLGFCLDFQNIFLLQGLLQKQLLTFRNKLGLLIDHMFPQKKIRFCGEHRMIMSIQTKVSLIWKTIVTSCRQRVIKYIGNIF